MMGGPDGYIEECVRDVLDNRSDKVWNHIFGDLLDRTDISQLIASACKLTEFDKNTTTAFGRTVDGRQTVIVYVILPILTERLALQMKEINDKPRSE